VDVDDFKELDGRGGALGGGGVEGSSLIDVEGPSWIGAADVSLLAEAPGLTADVSLLAEAPGLTFTTCIIFSLGVLAVAGDEVSRLDASCGVMGTSTAAPGASVLQSALLHAEGAGIFLMIFLNTFFGRGAS
jgi:hypothetical protein